MTCGVPLLPWHIHTGPAAESVRDVAWPAIASETSHLPLTEPFKSKSSRGSLSKGEDYSNGTPDLHSVCSCCSSWGDSTDTRNDHHRLSKWHMLCVAKQARRHACALVPAANGGSSLWTLSSPPPNSRNETWIWKLYRGKQTFA